MDAMIVERLGRLDPDFRVPLILRDILKFDDEELIYLEATQRRSIKDNEKFKQFRGVKGDNRIYLEPEEEVGVYTFKGVLRYYHFIGY